jgi:DNA-binding beta-propeller fold protein YncE
MGNRLFVIDIARRRVARVIETGEYRGLHDVAFRPGFPTRALVTAQTGQHIVEVDVVTGAIIAAVETNGDRSHLLAVTPDGRTVFTTNEGSATISRLDLETRRHERSFPASINVEGMVVTTDGTELWVGENAMGMVRVRDAGTGEFRAAFEGFRYPNRIAITPDGARVIISDPGCRAIVVADPATRSIVSVIRTPGPVMVGDAAPGGRIAFASVPGDRRVVAIDLVTGGVVARYRAGRAPDGLSWGPLPVASATIAR